MTLQALLQRKRKGPIAIQDNRDFGGEEVVEKVRQLELQLQGRRRAIVISSEALTILCALIACENLGTSLWIGHEYAGDAVLDEISELQQIEVRIGNGVETTRLRHAGLQDTSQGFAVHVMTSGTTGIPKIARHSLGALMGRVSAGRLFGGSWLLTYPPSTFAGTQVVLTAFATMSTLVAFRSTSLPKMVEAICEHSITHVSATPTFWRSALMVLPSSPHFTSLQQLTIGGEIVDQALLNQLSHRFPNARITHIYASTEAGSLFSVKDGQAGFPAEWLSTNIDGLELRVNEGLLQVRSPRSMQSYVSGHGNPFTQDGWLSTGDLVDVRNNRVFFLGRKDQMINVGGSKVAPEEIEKFLLGIEGVADVSVTGARNPVSGSVLKAEIVAAVGVGPEGLKKKVTQHCHSSLPAHKIPRIIRIVSKLAVSASGKKLGGLECDM